MPWIRWSSSDLVGLTAVTNKRFLLQDSASGIRAGVAAGMPVVAVATRNPEKSLLEAGASLLIKDYEDPKLWAALEEIDREEAKLKKASA